MGSSPSYEVQQHPIRKKETRPRRPSQNGKESTRSSKNRQNDPEASINPEQENSIRSNEPEHSSPFVLQEAPAQKNPHETDNMASYSAQQQNHPLNLSKKTTGVKQTHKQTNLDAQNALQQQHLPERNVRHGESNKPKMISSPQIEQLHHQPKELSKGRHYFKANTHQPIEEHTPNNNIKPPKHHRRSEEIDYKEYDSLHIRHKAIQEVVQRQHHPNAHHHPNVAREPIYQHERLYPKILKNLHHEPIKQINQSLTNRHQQHQHNLQEEAYEQPHKLHLYKRHILQHHAQQHEEHLLQRSMEVRAHPSMQEEEIRASLGQNHTPRPRVNSIDGEPKNPKVKSTGSDEKAPVQANFKKRKASLAIPNDPEKIQQGLNKLQEIEEKSIVDINKERQFNVTEYAANPAELITCRQGCGRKFQTDSIAKHEAACRRVFQRRRAAFDAQDHRIVSKQQRKLLKRGVQAKQSHHKHAEIPKWKAQSIALRAHIKMGMNSQYKPTDEEMQMLSEEHYIDVVACPVCERKFNKNAAKTHIPFCKAQLQKQLQRERFQKPKTKR